MYLRNLIDKYLTGNDEGMKILLTWFLNEVMEQEAEEQTGAGRYQRTGSRRAHRNGHRARTLRTRYGDVTLEKPLLREFPFQTKVFERYARVEKAIESIVLESYLQGVSTRKVQQVLSHLGIDQISPAYVSTLTKELDARVQEFFSRPLAPHMPYLFVDASYFKVRDGVRYCNKALLVIAGIRTDGMREILGARIADSENERTWEDLFMELKDRGLERVDLVISDGHRGIQSATERSFLGSSWQMCHVHFMRAVLRKIPRTRYGEIAGLLKESLTDSRTLQECARDLEVRGYPQVADTINRFQYSLFNYRSAPREHWRRIRTMNLLERVNKELKRRYRSIGAFPNDAALLRLAGAILMDSNEEWITSRRYVSAGEKIVGPDTGVQFTA
ncbi:MAG: IS256 family transposase [Methanomicrobiales archaeon]|nr:IS256 family transposase [Methanomicrobiales archaeon]